MTIRYKANFSHHLHDLDNLVPKYPQQYPPFCQPSTPEFVNAPRQRLSSISFLQSCNQHSSSNMTEVKEQSIKSLDEKINSIMKKHELKGDSQECRKALDPINSQIGARTCHPASNQPSSCIDNRPNELFNKYEENFAYFSQQNKNELKEQCRRLRQRSITIFEDSAKKKTEVVKATPQGKKQKENKYDSQIEKLNERIRQAEEKKKQLNIAFSPFTTTTKSNSHQRSSIKPQSHQLNSENIKGKTKVELQLLSKAQNCKRSIEPRGFIKHQGNSAINSQDNNRDWATPFKSININNSKIRPTNSKANINRLLQALISQIQLDEELRNLKIWFTFSSHKDKWECLKNEIISRNINLRIESIKSTFESNIEEHNPFFKWDGLPFQTGLDSLLTAYQKSEKHWRECILKRWSKEQLQAEDLKKTMIYEERTCWITIEDFVRFINIEKDTFYRNRDVYLIFKRLCPSAGNKIQYQCLIELLTGQRV